MKKIMTVKVGNSLTTFVHELYEDNTPKGVVFTIVLGLLYTFGARPDPRAGCGMECTGERIGDDYIWKITYTEISGEPGEDWGRLISEHVMSVEEYSEEPEKESV